MPRTSSSPVIVLHSIIHIDNWRSDFARGGIRIESCRGALVVRVGILFEWLLGCGEDFRFRSQQLEFYFAREGQPSVIGDYICVKSETAILIAQPLRDPVACLRARHVRFTGEVAKVSLRAGRIGYRLQPLFKLALLLLPGRAGSLGCR